MRVRPKRLIGMYNITDNSVSLETTNGSIEVSHEGSLLSKLCSNGMCVSSAGAISAQTSQSITVNGFTATLTVTASYQSNSPGGGPNLGSEVLGAGALVISYVIIGISDIGKACSEVLGEPCSAPAAGP